MTSVLSPQMVSRKYIPFLTCKGERKNGDWTKPMKRAAELRALSNDHHCYVPLYFFHFVSTYLRWDKLRKLMTMRVAIWLKSIKELPSILSGLLLDPFKPNYSWSP